MKREPRKHQKEALDALKDKKAFAILMAMRTGKTKVITDDFERCVENREIDDLFVIAPAGAYLTWKEAMPLDLTIDAYIFAWKSSLAKNKVYQQELSRFFCYGGPRVFLMNVEAISSMEKSRDLAEKFMDRRVMLVIDESVIIKNRQSICSKFIVNHLAPRAKMRRILSGLVAPRSPLDVYQQYKFLNKNILPESYPDFERTYANIKRLCKLPHYVIKNKYKTVFKKLPPTGTSPQDWVDAIIAANEYIEHIPIVEGFKDIDKLHDRLAPHSFRVRLEDVYDMPASDYSFYDVPLTPEQERIYADMRDLAYADLNALDTVTAANVIAQIIRLHQIVCGFSKNELDEVVDLDENRTAAVADILENYDGKAIIWCAYKHSVEKTKLALQKIYGPQSVALFYGDNRNEREDEEKKFKTSDECRFMVATPDAGGRGRTWDCANLTIYHSCRSNLDHRLQSEERVKNVGKRNPVVYVDLRCPNTVDERIVQALRDKIDLASAVTGETWKEWLI